MCPENAAGVNFTHHRELFEVVGFAIDVRAYIEENGRPTRGGGKNRRQRRSIHARQSSEHHLGRGHRGAGVAGSNESSGASFANEPQPHTHGRISLAAYSGRSLLAHADHFRRMDDIDRQGLYPGVLVDLAIELFANLSLAADEENLNIV